MLYDFFTILALLELSPSLTAQFKQGKTPSSSTRTSTTYQQYPSYTPYPSNKPYHTPQNTKPHHLQNTKPCHTTTKKPPSHTTFKIPSHTIPPLEYQALSYHLQNTTNHATSRIPSHTIPSLEYQATPHLEHQTIPCHITSKNPRTHNLKLN